MSNEGLEFETPSKYIIEELQLSGLIRPRPDPGN